MKKNKTGFTLIELLVVVAILTLMITLVVIATVNYRSKAIMSKITVTLSNVRNAAALIYNADSSYLAICDSGHLNASYNDLKTIKEEIERYTTTPNAYCSSTAYCVDVSRESNSTCVDSSGVVKEAQTCNSTTLVCE